ncbi:MAG: aspartate/glutamate racemase family protein [Peptostreptococcaceae bacterium]|nr:aspartate/glutamate racemase family protein [Peptostreptococcaceae bacterium]
MTTFNNYGQRAKIGLAYPSTGLVMEPEFYLMAPEGVITITTRMMADDVSAENVAKFRNLTLDATKILASAKPDIIVLGCTSGSFIQGSGYDKKIIEDMEAVSKGIPCTTTSTAVVEALEKLGIKKIAVITPYVDDINVMAKRFLNDHGFEIVNFIGQGMLDDYEINSQSLEKIEKLIREVDSQEAEAIVVLCTSMKGVPILSRLERELGKPIITAIQATFWQSLRKLNIDDKIQGYGCLLEL